ncbi:MAG: ATP-binding protein [Oscillatoriaceae bacterium SKW80]|nr:ATP-binding protein [Oscillatoriaceae bacterium SKYG93]MCX8119435.1 ATP-binding protein [Oscillatoriaceae bacterium SKW80]MDW8454901.1 ATP-binding protein [Oscillatoriaceae cyanobacterium SKYGB_i_bin93]HIK28320.1 PAS domain S-box protein [Oscillatoriaceae cyanobacterium M7585_C2015_266]
MKSLLKKILAPRRQEYLILDNNLIIVDASIGVQRFADCSNEVRIGQDARHCFPELFGTENILRAILGGKQEYFELKGISRNLENNTPLYVDIYITNSNEENQNTLVVLIEDVTELMLIKQSLVQRANEANLLLSALAVSKEYIDKVVNSMADALVVTNYSGRIKTVNPSALELFGYTREEMIGLSLSEIFADRDVLQLQHENLSEQDAIKDIEVKCKKKNGEEVSIAFSCSSIQTEKNQERDFVYIGRDITERKRAEEETRKAIEKEKELAALKSRFVAMTSHEFRNPLMTIISSVILLEEEWSSYKEVFNNEDIPLYLQMIQSAARQMLDLLNDVLIIEKAEAKKLEFEPNSLDLVKFCQQLVKEIELSTEKKYSINFICPWKSFTVNMDRKLLRQILANLLSNAIKYSPDNKTIRFQISCKSEEAIFEIQDQGIGIPPEDQKRLFETFYRGSNTGEISGTGLGLAIVKKAVELHGGKIAITSEVGVGTTVRVVIPICRQAPKQ